MYDFAGRLKANQFGVDGTSGKRAYEQTLSYDGFSDLTSREISYWENAESMTATYTNGRNAVSTYDAAGNITHNGLSDEYQLATKGRIRAISISQMMPGNLDTKLVRIPER